MKGVHMVKQVGLVILVWSIDQDMLYHICSIV